MLVSRCSLAASSLGSLAANALAALATLSLIACSGARREPTPPPNAAQPGTPDCIPIDGDPNGLHWDAQTQSLLIADSKNGRILKWTEAGGVVPFVVLPDTAKGGGLGQIVRSAEGDLLVALLGTSSAGGVVRVAPSGETSVVAELAPERRRIGLTVAPDGRVFDTWFTRNESHEGDGGVSELDVDGGETDLIAGLKKPVGILALRDTLFVSDQAQGKILQAPLADPTTLTALASVEQPDLLAAGPDGAIFAGSGKGGVQRIERSGAVSLALPSAQQIRGVAYDPEKRRLFASEQDADKADGAQNALCIMGLPAAE
jgi:sugar lactone lactonase YvrE